MEYVSWQKQVPKIIKEIHIAYSKSGMFHSVEEISKHFF